MTERPMFGPETEPNAFVQWKGTNVCMDVRCVCGGGGHVDGFFAYTVKCGDCGRLYATPAYIELREITPEQNGGAQPLICE